MRNLLSTLMAIFLLTACSILPPVKTDNYTTYVFNSIPNNTNKSYGHKTLYVSQVTADPLYSTSEMAYSTHQYQVEYFAKNRWSDTPAKMLRPLIIQSLKNTKHFHAVTSSTGPIRYDYMLNIQLLELRQLFISHSSFVVFKINAEIIDMKTNQIIASKTFTTIEGARYCSPLGGVIATNKAVNATLNELDHFCINAI